MGRSRRGGSGWRGLAGIVLVLPVAGCAGGAAGHQVERRCLDVGPRVPGGLGGFRPSDDVQRLAVSQSVPCLEGPPSVDSGSSVRPLSPGVVEPLAPSPVTLRQVVDLRNDEAAPVTVACSGCRRQVLEPGRTVRFSVSGDQRVVLTSKD